LRVLHARNEIQQDTLDWVELSGVDEWVDADVEIRDDHYSVEAVAMKRDFGVKNGKEKVNIRGSPGDGEQPADKDHGLDNAGLDAV